MMRKALFLLLTLVLVACGTDSRHFKIDGRLIHLNQGEFYVYSPDGGKEGLDTIKVQSGRFTYEATCDRPYTLVIIFPNYSEQPVFAQPGKSVSIEGDASHLKEMTVKGTKDNELMTAFRQQAASASPPEAAKYAEQFVADHPASPVGSYLVRKYFMQSERPDAKKAARLIQTMLQAQPDNGYLKRLQRSASDMTTLAVGSPVPQFAATTTDGKTLTQADLNAPGGCAVVAFATWNYESVTQLRRLCERSRQKETSLKVVGVCIDASPADCRRTLKNNQIDCPVVCDGNMIDGRTFRTLGFSSIPGNLIVRQGRIAKLNLSAEDIMKE